MRRCLRSGSVKKMKVVTPGGRTVVHFKEEKPNYQQCGNCGVKLARSRELQTAKSSKRPERRFPEFCVECSRETLKVRLLGGTLEKKVLGD